MDNLELLELIKFKYKTDILGIVTNRPNRAIVEINPQILFKISTYLFKEHDLRFIIASAMDAVGHYEIIYHFSKDDTGFMINLRTSVPYEKPKIESLVPLFVAADWIEREMHELFGIEFINHPDLVPLLSGGNWDMDAFPYRKKK